MKAFALLTPCAVLACLWALQRLEVWMTATSGPRARARTNTASHYGSASVRPEAKTSPRG